MGWISSSLFACSVMLYAAGAGDAIGVCAGLFGTVVSIVNATVEFGRNRRA